MHSCECAKRIKQWFFTGLLVIRMRIHGIQKEEPRRSVEIDAKTDEMSEVMEQQRDITVKLMNLMTFPGARFIFRRRN